MANLPVSKVSTDVHTGILSPEIREKIVATVKARSFTEAEQAILIDALVRLHVTPTMDSLAEVARQVRHDVQSGYRFPFDDRQSLLRAEAVAVGIDGKLADGIIEAAFKKAAAELDAEREALPENVARRELLAKVVPGSSLETVRSAVYQAVKEGTLTPEQVSGAVLPKVTKHAARDEKEQQARNTAMAKAVTEGIQAATTDWSATDTPEMALLRKSPTVGNVLGLVDKAARQESLYVEAAVWERAMNIALLEQDGIVALPEFEIDRAIERECAVMKQNPTLAQLKESTLKVARRGNDINLDTFSRLVTAMNNPHTQVTAPVVQADGVLTVPATEPTDQGPQPRSAIVKTTYHNPKDHDYQPIDGWAPSGRTEKLLPDENGRIAAGREPGTVADFGGSGGRTFTPPATPAEPQVVKGKKGTFTQSEIRQTIRRNANISKNHDSLAEMRGIKGGV